MRVIVMACVLLLGTGCATGDKFNKTYDPDQIPVTDSTAMKIAKFGGYSYGLRDFSRKDMDEMVLKPWEEYRTASNMEFVARSANGLIGGGLGGLGLGMFMAVAKGNRKPPASHWNCLIMLMPESEATDRIEAGKKLQRYLDVAIDASLPENVPVVADWHEKEGSFLGRGADITSEACEKSEKKCRFGYHIRKVKLEEVDLKGLVNKKRVYTTKQGKSNLGLGPGDVYNRLDFYRNTSELLPPYVWLYISPFMADIPYSVVLNQGKVYEFISGT